jgi:hypothetical protein
MRSALHFLLCVLAAAPLLLANFALTLALWLYVLADRVLPGATRGNCWSYVAPLVWREGGHLMMRPAHGVRLLWLGIVQHVSWARTVDGHIEQTEPVERYKGPALLWRWVYFDFGVRGHDTEPARPWRDSWKGKL